MPTKKKPSLITSGPLMILLHLGTKGPGVIPALRLGQVD